MWGSAEVRPEAHTIRRNSMIRIGINGFGRIGRYLLRVMHLFPQCEVVVINGHRATNEEMAYLLKYDSVHGRFPGKVQATENGLKIDDHEIAITRCGKGEWKWADYGVDIVVETSGTLMLILIMMKTLILMVQGVNCFFVCSRNFLKN